MTTNRLSLLIAVGIILGFLLSFAVTAQTNTVDTNGWTVAEPHDATVPPPPDAPPPPTSEPPPMPTSVPVVAEDGTVKIVPLRWAYIGGCETVTNADETIYHIITATNFVAKPKDTIIFEVVYKTALTNEAWTHTGIEVRVPMLMIKETNVFFTTIGTFE